MALALVGVVVWITTVGAVYYVAYLRGFKAGYRCHNDWFNRGLDRLRDAKHWYVLAAMADAMIGAEISEMAAIDAEGVRRLAREEQEGRRS